MRDIALVVLTLDRRPSGGTNYLDTLLARLVSSGVQRSPRLARFCVCGGDARSGLGPYGGPVDGLDAAAVWWLPAPKRLRPQESAARALVCGAQAAARWVLYVEDDVDVCGEFLDSIGAWLDDYATDRCRVYTFGSAHSAVRGASRIGRRMVEFPLAQFWGTTCIAIRAADVVSLAAYWADPRHTLMYDLLVHGWHRQAWPDDSDPVVRASAPSFVQHMGDLSVLAPERTATIRYSTWPGRDWRYVGRQQQEATR